MNKEKLHEYEKVMHGFSFGFQQSFMQFLAVLEAEEFTLDDVKKYIPVRIKLWEKEAKEAEKTRRFLERKCPECSGLMILFPVNIDPGTQTGDPEDNSVWFCQKQACQETIYNKDTIEQIVKKGQLAQRKGSTKKQVPIKKRK